MRSKRLCFIVSLAVLFTICVWWLVTRKSKIYGSFSPPVRFDQLENSKDLRYKIWRNLWKSQVEIRHDDITLVTQTSQSNLHHLEELSKSWDGSISVAVFITGADISDFLDHLRVLVICNPSLANRVFIHAVLPTSHPPFDRLIRINSDIVCINRRAGTAYKHEQKNYVLAEIPYPVNLLRNVALEKVRTDYVLVVDIDMLPSKNLRATLLSMPLLNQHFAAIVVPAFELEVSNAVPSNRKDVLEYWQAGKIRPFYEKVCWKCQKYTDYEKWKNGDHSPTYEVTWYDPWEPFYVSLKQAVVYDERFEQYGFNRISQLCHMHMSGFRFYVLRDSFLLHLGFKEKRDFHSTKDEENRRNKIIYGQVKREMLEKYPMAGRKC